MDATEELETVATSAGGPLVLGRYRLGARLGSGGFGTVFAGHDERLKRAVAVKVIPGGPAPDSDRASREAQAVARLDHPGIVAVFDAGDDGEARYLVSELVRGCTLDRLAAEGELSDRDVVRVGLALADALEHAHGRGVIHRDVKPQNVIVPDSPRSGRSAAKLTDFGVAHLAGDEPLTRTGDVVGTLAYMAPEQAAGRRVDERVDLYSLALVLYEALAGANPIRAGSPAATARRLGTVLPPLRQVRRDLPVELSSALDRALLPRPEDRGTVAELADVLLEALPEVSDAGGTIATHPLERARAPARPRAAARAAAALAAAGLVLAGTTLVPDPPLAPPAAAGLAAVAVAALPRAGWLAAAAALVVVLAGPRPGAALVVASAAAVPPLLLPGRARRGRTGDGSDGDRGRAAGRSEGSGRDRGRAGGRSEGSGRDRNRAGGRGTAWSLPALAPVLGLAALALAYPAVAGRARTAWRRLALGAAGACWLLLAPPLLDRALLFDPRVPAGWDRDAGRALDGVIEPLATSGILVLAAVWGLGAVVLPWLVRGRSLAVDFVGAAAWAAGVAAATQSAAEWAGAGPPRGLVAGALVAWALALAVPRVMARDTVGS